MPGVSRLNKLTSQNAAGNGGRGSGLAKDLPPGVSAADVQKSRDAQVAARQAQLAGDAPAKAPAAPTGNTGHLFTGLAEALNTYQNQLVAEKKQSIADVYEFEFVPSALGASKVKKPGSTDKSKTAGKNVTTAKQALDQKTDSVNNNSQNYQVEAGMQIVQLIDQIMRGSDYVALQANTTFDPITQEPKASNGTGTGMVTWYNITVTATSLGLDSIRKDFAYNIKYTITPYALSKLQSEFFPDSVYRGSHKSYNYWFTGTNTQILNFEQDYNALYKIVISGTGPSMKKSKQVQDYRDQYSYAVMPTSSQKTGQSTGTYTSTVPDSAADFLYSPTDYGLAKVKIVGDPAWLQQGSVCGTSGSQNFNFQPFNPDGSINYDSQQIVFDISWNQPQDYDMTTGVMNIKGDIQGRARVNNTYIASECTSTFSRGRFEQELEGKLLIEDKPAAAPDEVRPPVQTTQAKPKDTPPDRSREYALKGFKGTDLPPVGTDTTGAFVGYRSPGIRRKTILDPNGYGDA
jgi:hypothetical protein